MLVRVDFENGEFIHLNPDLVVSVQTTPDWMAGADGPLVTVTMASDTQWLIPGTVEEVLRKLGFST
jgi:hypothetical protein